MMKLLQMIQRNMSIHDVDRVVLPVCRKRTAKGRLHDAAFDEVKALMGEKPFLTWAQAGRIIENKHGFKKGSGLYQRCWRAEKESQS